MYIISTFIGIYKKYDTPVYPSKEIVMGTRNYVENVRHHLLEVSNGAIMAFDLLCTVPSDPERARNCTLWFFLATYKSKLVNDNYSGISIKQFTDDIRNVYQQIHDINAHVPSGFLLSAQNLTLTASSKFKMVYSIFITLLYIIYA